MNYEIIQGDCLKVLKTLPSEHVNTCITSPPYWGLRDYGNKEQIGLEDSPQEFIEKMVSVFKEVKRVLRDDGTLWLNLGDTYASATKGGRFKHAIGHKQASNKGSKIDSTMKLNHEAKEKDLLGLPWRVALALQDDGWYLRSDIIWHKPNPMPESVEDRPTKAHEYIFLLSKNAQYYYDNDSIREPITESTLERISQDIENQAGSTRAHAGAKSNGPMKAFIKAHEENDIEHPLGRNKRTVWTVPVYGFKEAHFATYPPKLIKPCILAGCPREGIVLDPFFGAGTTGLVALQNSRNFIGIELNAEYIEIAKKRLLLEDTTPTMFDL